MPNRTYHPRGELVHGYTATTHPLYNTWVSLKQRCCNQNNPAYKHYGARGVTICQRWSEFKNFANDMGLKPSEAFSLDRIDNNKGYEPGNIRWASAKVQNRNARSNRKLELNGVSMLLTDWATHLGITKSTLSYRLKKWDLEKALTTPAMAGKS